MAMPSRIRPVPFYAHPGCRVGNAASEPLTSAGFPAAQFMNPGAAQPPFVYAGKRPLDSFA
jgi:hypothetical protein